MNLRLKYAFISFLAGCLLVSCAPVPSQTLLVSVWGAPVELGQAEQVDAPALWVTENRLSAAWIGADETGVHQDIRAITPQGLSERVVLPLPPRNPYMQQLYPAEFDNLHLLWLDSDDAGEPRVYSALITPDLEVARGPTVISDEATWRYVGLSSPDGSLWVVSAGGVAYEPGLYARYVDAQGRPQLRENPQVVTDADWPALVAATDGTAYLFWIQPSSGQVFKSVFWSGEVSALQPITQTVALNSGDRLLDFHAALDRTHAYLFWNLVRADGSAETWFAAGEFDAFPWSLPQRLGVSISTASFETGFNSGAASVASVGESWISWGTPLTGQFDLLPIAALFDSKTLGIVYLQNGQVVAAQEIVSVSRLIGLPRLFTDRDRFLYLAWSEPGDDGRAHLRLTTSRRS